MVSSSNASFLGPSFWVASSRVYVWSQTTTESGDLTSDSTNRGSSSGWTIVIQVADSAGNAGNRAAGPVMAKPGTRLATRVAGLVLDRRWARRGAVVVPWVLRYPRERVPVTEWSGSDGLPELECARPPSFGLDPCYPAGSSQPGR